MKKPFLIALGIIMGIALSNLSVSQAFDFDSDVLNAIKNANAITVGDPEEICNVEHCNGFSFLNHEQIQTSRAYFSQLRLDAGREPVRVRFGQQLILSELSDPPTQAQINQNVLEMRAYLIDRGLARDENGPVEP